MCLTIGACLQSLTPGVSPQASAGGEEENEEGGGSAAAHLLEALRQFRLHHRGQYRAVLKESLATYSTQRGESAARGKGEQGTTPDNNGKAGREQSASHPSPPSSLPSPATAKPEGILDVPVPETNSFSG